MKVAVFTDNDFDKTNGVTTTLKALLACAPADVRPRIYTMSDLGVDEPDYLAVKGVGVPIPFYSEMRMYWPRLAELRRHLVADEIRLVHMTTPGPMALAARHLCGDLGLPLVGSFHTQLQEYTTLLSGSKTLGALMGTYMRWVYGRCRRVLVPSADTREQLGSAGWQVTRLAVWPRGVNPVRFSPDRRSAELRERWRVSERRPAVLYAGRLSREKGLDQFEPLESLLWRNRISHRLVFVGDGPMGPELRQRFPDSVFLGTVPHDQVAIAMASADVFVFPSETDTAGNVVLEAQASGLPVLVTDVGGPQENMRHGTTGFVYRRRDTADLCWRLSSLLCDSDLRNQMSRVARADVTSRSWHAAMGPVYSAYRDATRDLAPALASEPAASSLPHAVSGS